MNLRAIEEEKEQKLLYEEKQVICNTKCSNIDCYHKTSHKQTTGCLEQCIRENSGACINISQIN